jgi:hypothetical protein
VERHGQCHAFTPEVSMAERPTDLGQVVERGGR